jgi:hypothetical protein
MQVDERGASTVVAHARHQLTRICARIGDELVSGMPQVVKVSADQAVAAAAGIQTRR